MLEGIILELLIISLSANVILTIISFALIIVVTIKHIKENHISAAK